MPQIRMDFAAQDQAINAVKATTNQITQHLQEMKQLHESIQTVWQDHGGQSHHQVATTHITALGSAGEFTGKMSYAMSSSMVDYQATVNNASNGLLTTSAPQNIT